MGCLSLMSSWFHILSRYVRYLHNTWAIGAFSRFWLNSKGLKSYGEVSKAPNKCCKGPMCSLGHSSPIHSSNFLFPSLVVSVNCPYSASRNRWKAASNLWHAQVIKLDSSQSSGESYSILALTPKGHFNYSHCLVNKLSLTYRLSFSNAQETRPLKGYQYEAEIHNFVHSYLLKGGWHYH